MSELQGDEVWWSSGSGRIELRISKYLAENTATPGENLPMVQVAVRELREQLDKLDPKVVIQELDEWGCWEGEELEDYTGNLERLVWLACWDLVEQGFDEAN